MIQFRFCNSASCGVLRLVDGPGEVEEGSNRTVVCFIALLVRSSLSDMLFERRREKYFDSRAWWL